MSATSARHAIRSSRRASVKRTEYLRVCYRHRPSLSSSLLSSVPPFSSPPAAAASAITSRYFSSEHNNEETTSSSHRPSHIPYRPWQDQRLPLDVRVNKFVEVELGELGYHAVAFDALALADVCCRNKGSGFVGMKLAHDVLDRSLAEKRHFDLNLTGRDQDTNSNSSLFGVPLQLFKTILYGWCNLATKGKIAEVRMRELMDLVLEVARHDTEILKQPQSADSNSNSNNNEKDPRLLPNTDLFNTYLMGLKNASRVSRTAAGSLIAVLDEMEHCHKKHGWHTKPNTKTYTLIISALANSGIKEAGQRAEGVLRRLIKAHEQEKELYLEQYGEPYNTAEPSLNKRRIPTPDIVVYTSVIRGYSHGPSVRDATRAKELLIEYISSNDGNAKPDTLLFTSVIAAYAALAQNTGISNEARLAAAQDAEEVLEMMLRDYENNGGTLFMVEPYNACINAYAKCGSPEAVVRAEEILQKLLSDYADDNNNIAPNTVTFNTALSAWARCADQVEDAPQKAEELLELQVELVESKVLDERSRTDTQSFAAVMSAYGRSNNPEKVQHTYRLLRAMLGGIADGKVSVGSNLVVPFTTVLNAAAFSKLAPSPATDAATNPTNDATTFDTSGFDSSPSAADDIYTIALQTYRELKEDAFRVGCKPDHMAFAAMLEVLAVHTHPTSVERRQMVQLVFEDACAAGEVSKLVLKALFRASPDKKLVASLLKTNEVADHPTNNIDELPRAWTRNVAHKFRYTKPRRRTAPRRN